MPVMDKQAMVCPHCHHYVSESAKYWNDPYNYYCPWSFCGKKFPPPEKFFSNNEIKRRMTIFREIDKEEKKWEQANKEDK